MFFSQFGFCHFIYILSLPCEVLVFIAFVFAVVALWMWSRFRCHGECVQSALLCCCSAFCRHLSASPLVDTRCWCQTSHLRQAAFASPHAAFCLDVVCACRWCPFLPLRLCFSFQLSVTGTPAYHLYVGCHVDGAVSVL